MINLFHQHRQGRPQQLFTATLRRRLWKKTYRGYKVSKDPTMNLQSGPINSFSEHILFFQECLAMYINPN